jgi:hypothetical protein
MIAFTKSRVREVTIILVVLLGASSSAFAEEPVASQGTTEASAPWFQRSLVGLEVGPTGSQFGSSASDTGFAVRFNGRDIARATKESGAEYLVIWAREGEWAFCLARECAHRKNTAKLNFNEFRCRISSLEDLVWSVQQRSLGI